MITGNELLHPALLVLFIIVYVQVCDVCVALCANRHVWRLEDHLVESVLPLYVCVCSGAWTQVTRPELQTPLSAASLADP